MIIGLGIDLVEIERIRRSLERFGTRFTDKLLHAVEQEDLLPGRDLTSAGMAARLAARFAAKEAGVKALGSGFSGGIGPHDVRVASLPSGQPVISFHGKAKELADALGVARTHLSLTHSQHSAAAVVIIESAER